jgi:hypothetical protein
MFEGDSTQFQPRIERAKEANTGTHERVAAEIFVGPEQEELRSALQNLRLLKSALTSV